VADCPKAEPGQGEIAFAGAADIGELLLTSGVLGLLSVLLAVRRQALRRAQGKSRCPQEDELNGQAQERANTLSENQYTIDMCLLGGTIDYVIVQ